MYTSKEIRQRFLDFFKSREHLIVPSAPIVVKNDPTLMFTNAGMNQFKDAFLGNSSAAAPRIADTQKCLRVSGKHNDLEEVGVDTYHHTMFEMLGNWSFGDYFKEEAIAFAWELLIDVFGIDKDRVYVTVFEGDPNDGLELDAESVAYWKKHISEDRILACDKKNNFWEMGDTGPCGPCSEIHVDLRSDEERATVSGHSLVNADHPEVVEIWNLVFIQYNRLANGSLSELPARHVDTGMGFERLCMVLQEKQSTYDTDVFAGLIEHVERSTGYTYGKDKETDIAIRVIVDHIRAIVFTIADGQLPSNTGAGYVIRRILRRAVRYYYNFLERKSPLLTELVPVLSAQYDGVFSEVSKQLNFIQKVVREEEVNFLRTLSKGLDRLHAMLQSNDELDGAAVFELYDTYGFPADLTRLIASERGKTIDEAGFETALEAQRERSRSAAASESGDWTVFRNIDGVEFLGYDDLETASQIVKYRTVKEKKKTYTQVVLDRTPFYAESGGQAGDKGKLILDNRVYKVFDTKKENDLIIHYLADELKLDDEPVQAVVDPANRASSAHNHSATHLLHAALKQVLGDHVDQKGSFLNADGLRFDFSHFAKVTPEEIREVEEIVNDHIFNSIDLEEIRYLPKQDALDMGANALFGEKYGDEVRVIAFDRKFSVELCGGTHVNATGEIGLFKIVQESAVAAGVRRIEAVTGPAAYNFLNKAYEEREAVWNLLRQPKDVEKAVQSLIAEQSTLRKQIESFEKQQWNSTREDLRSRFRDINGTSVLIESVDGLSADGIKKICFDLRNESGPLVILLASNYQGKPLLGLLISDDLVESKDLDAGKSIREIAKHIRGGGGGQKFFATAGGGYAEGIPAALEHAKNLFESALS